MSDNQQRPDPATDDHGNELKSAAYRRHRQVEQAQAAQRKSIGHMFRNLYDALNDLQDNLNGLQVETEREIAFRSVLMQMWDALNITANLVAELHSDAEEIEREIDNVNLVEELQARGYNVALSHSPEESLEIIQRHAEQNAAPNNTE